MQKILIVEDDIDIQDILKNHLIDAGYEVAVASDGVGGHCNVWGYHRPCAVRHHAP